MELADRNGCRQHRDIAASLRQSYYLESERSCGERILPLRRTGVQSDKRQYKHSQNTLRQLLLVITILFPSNIAQGNEIRSVRVRCREILFAPAISK